MKRGQTFTEFTLILLAIAVLAFLSYRAIGNGVMTMASRIDSSVGGA